LPHLLTTGYGTSRASGNVRLESAKWAKADIDQVAVHEIRNRANNDDHPVSMTPPIIDADRRHPLDDERDREGIGQVGVGDRGRHGAAGGLALAADL
jgi:hypothetical protein